MASVRRKSSYSVGNGGNCVAVATQAESVVVEDTKQDRQPQAQRARLTVPAPAWQSFVATLK